MWAGWKAGTIGSERALLMRRLPEEPGGGGQGSRGGLHDRLTNTQTFCHRSIPNLSGPDENDSELQHM